MTHFFREGHWRTSSLGNMHWVEGHHVNRDQWDRGESNNNCAFLEYLRAPIVSDTSGLNWRRDKIHYETYVNPNAKCPVCGADVFFYQSPYGGKVFFDELGPPWPKHPCTDQSGFSIGKNPIAPASGGKKCFNWTDFFDPKEWKPFPIELIKKEGGVRIFRKDNMYKNLSHLGHIYTELHNKIYGKILIFPDNFPEETPIYWRLFQDDPCYIEVSTIIDDGEGVFKECYEKIAAWILTNEDLKKIYIDGHGPSGTTFNEMGWWLSFGKKTIKNKHVYHKIHGSDGRNARELFKRAGKKGIWEGFNNLGVMLREGIGGKKDLKAAYACFEKAAESLNAKPLRHLANFYRDGIVCAKNNEYATYLEELAVLDEEEDSNI